MAICHVARNMAEFLLTKVFVNFVKYVCNTDIIINTSSKIPGKSTEQWQNRKLNRKQILRKTHFSHHHKHGTKLPEKNIALLLDFFPDKDSPNTLSTIACFVIRSGWSCVNRNMLQNGNQRVLSLMPSTVWYS